jgi:hypothetical protein
MEDQLQRGTRLNKWAFRLGLLNILLFIIVSGPTAAMATLAIRNPPPRRKGRWKPWVALAIGMLWMGIYAAALATPDFAEGDTGFALFLFFTFVVPTPLGMLGAMVWPISGERRRPRWLWVLSLLAIVFLGLGIFGLLSNRNTVSTVAGIIGGITDVRELDIGDCFEDLGTGDVSDVIVVDCNNQHGFEVYAFGNLNGNSGDFPGDKAILSELGDICVASFEGYVGRSYERSSYDYFMVYPSEEGWNLGDREGTCTVVTVEDGQVVVTTGSARGTGR